MCLTKLGLAEVLYTHGEPLFKQLHAIDSGSIACARITMLLNIRFHKTNLPAYFLDCEFIVNVKIIFMFH